MAIKHFVPAGFHSRSVFFQDALKTSDQRTIIPYSQFDRLLKEKKISSVNITDTHIQGELKEQLENGNRQFTTAKVEDETDIYRP